MRDKIDLDKARWRITPVAEGANRHRTSFRRAETRPPQPVITNAPPSPAYRIVSPAPATPAAGLTGDRHRHLRRGPPGASPVGLEKTALVVESLRTVLAAGNTDSQVFRRFWGLPPPRVRRGAREPTATNPIDTDAVALVVPKIDAEMPLRCEGSSRLNSAARGSTLTIAQPLVPSLEQYVW